jgi:hypothetical protein
MKLIFVHGRAQEEYEDQALKNDWVNSLKIGLAKSNLTLPGDVKIEFPYYGKLLMKLIHEAEAKDIKSEARRSGETVDESAELAFFEEYLREVIENADLSAAEKAEMRRLLRQTRSGPLDWAPVRAVLAFLDKSTTISSLSIASITKDVFMYLHLGNIKRQINDVVAKSFDAGPCVVVGHSLGSVVSYQVLQNHPEYDVRKFITVGSPLGVNGIRSTFKQVSVPKCVKNGWYNAFDVRDIVALNPLNQEFFNVQPPIVNANHVKNPTPNRHGISGYLEDKEVASEIYRALAG